MPALMIAGTSSHVGKSVIATALCRIFSKMGYNVAPFKAQNMSLNSFVTKDGKEIAIAQAFQAKACGIEPNELMNPILLKPKGNKISQLVVLGEAVKDVSALEYYKEVGWLLKVVEQAYKKLEKEFDMIIIEGAGGIAEINLYDRDIANIGIARIAKPSIFIVGDIDRGGVFASLYGTYKLLPEDVANLVKGFIINKFRGDVTLLKSGIEKLEEITGVRVLGIIPFVDITFTPEDSLSLEDWSNEEARIAVIRFPRISNWTDFEYLKPAGVKFVWKRDDLSEFDVVILPGTKDTIADLKELKSAGIDESLKRIAGKIPIIGICGGYQMLGKELIDRGVEHGNIRAKGLGLLDAVTIFDEFKKRTVQVVKTVTGDAVIIDKIKGQKVWGYEIHKGKTFASKPVFEDDGCASDDGMVWGTYLHGLFSNENVLKAFADYLGVKIDKGEDWIDKFAEVVERNIDIEYIIRKI
jgi:adenosylcobyric acid synthase